MLKRIGFILLVLFSLKNVCAQNLDPLLTKDVESQKHWVDSIMSSLSVDQKIGQLFMVAAYSNKDEKHEKFITEMIEKYPTGKGVTIIG